MAGCGVLPGTHPMPHDPAQYGDRIADLYDDLFPALAPDHPGIAFLAGLAGTGRALELGIGTGRFALPLAARGVRVEGVDASQAMVARLRAKPGGERIPVTMGDFADPRVEGPFSLVFIVFNTLFGLLTQEDQVGCFASVARRLAPGGAFVIEAFVPDLGRFDRGQRVAVTHLGAELVDLEASRHDLATQRIDTHVVRVTPTGSRFVPVSIRYAWASELDLMARLAGLRLRERWGSFARTPFTSASPGHVSVYERPA
jgi:SAM-dependent methyltransferase